MNDCKVWCVGEIFKKVAEEAVARGEAPHEVPVADLRDRLRELGAIVDWEG